MIPLALHQHSAPAAALPAAPGDGMTPPDGFALAVSAALAPSNPNSSAGSAYKQEPPLAGAALAAVAAPPLAMPVSTAIALLPAAMAGPAAIPVATADPAALPAASAGPPALPAATAGPAALPVAPAIPAAIPTATAGPAAIPSATAGPTAIPTATASPTAFPAEEPASPALQPEAATGQAAPVLAAPLPETLAPPLMEAPSNSSAEAAAAAPLQTPSPPAEVPPLPSVVNDARQPAAEMPETVSQAPAMSQAPALPGRDQPLPAAAETSRPALSTATKSRVAAKIGAASSSETAGVPLDATAIASAATPAVPPVFHQGPAAVDGPEITPGGTAESNIVSSTPLSTRAEAALAELAAGAAKTAPTSGTAAPFADKLAANDVSAPAGASAPDAAATGTSVPTPVVASLPPTGPASPLAMLTVVAHATPTVTARAGQIGREMGVQIARTVLDGNSQVTIRLDPIEMGKIEVKLSFDDKGSLRAVVAAESPAALDLLRRDTADLTRALSDAGVRSDAQSFRFDSRSGSSDGGQFWQRQQQGSRQPNQSGGGHPDSAAPTEEPVYRSLRSSGRVDLMA